MSDNKSGSGGIGFTGLLAILFIGLKLTGHIDWSWFWVLAPIWIPFAIILTILGAVGVFIGGVGLLNKIVGWRRSKKKVLKKINPNKQLSDLLKKEWAKKSPSLSVAPMPSSSSALNATTEGKGYTSSSSVSVTVGATGMVEKLVAEIEGVSSEEMEEFDQAISDMFDEDEPQNAEEEALGQSLFFGMKNSDYILGSVDDAGTQSKPKKKKKKQRKDRKTYGRSFRTLEI